jgi:hypothetical protein
MSVVTFELKEEHIKLLKYLRWSLNNDNVIVGVNDDGEDIAPPFGENNIYDAIDLILNGVPDNFNPLTAENSREYSSEEKEKWDKLYSELPIALEIILSTSSFDLGSYKTKHHLHDWKKKPNEIN